MLGTEGKKEEKSRLRGGEKGEEDGRTRQGPRRRGSYWRVRGRKNLKNHYGGEEKTICKHRCPELEGGRSGSSRKESCVNEEKEHWKLLERVEGGGIIKTLLVV